MALVIDLVGLVVADLFLIVSLGNVRLLLLQFAAMLDYFSDVSSREDYLSVDMIGRMRVLEEKSVESVDGEVEG